MLRPLILALATSTWSAPEPEEGPVRLRWEAPATCPDVDQVRARTESLLARALADPDHPPVEASITVWARGSRWYAALELATPAGRRVRTLHAGSCAALADASALLLAVTIDPTAGSASPAPQPPRAAIDRHPIAVPDAVPVPEKVPLLRAVARAPVPRDIAPSSPASRPRPAGFVGAAFALQGGGAPGLAPGVVGAVGLLWPRARLLLAGAFAAPATSRAIAPDVRLNARQAWGAVAGCARLVRRRLDVPLCGGWFAGAVRAVATGVDAGRPLRLPWTGPLLGTGVHLALHPSVALTVDVLALIPVLRPSFRVDGIGVVHQASGVAASGQLGLEVRFP